MEYLLVRDNQTGKTLQILRHLPNPNYTVIQDMAVEDVKRVSIGKVIRNWMKDRKEEKTLVNS